MASSKAGRGSDQFMLRLPDGMRDSIRDAAEANSRSMNAEIVARLEASFRPDDAAGLKEAALVAESLRKNLTERMVTMDARLKWLDEREDRVREREAQVRKREDQLEVDIEQRLAARREELEAELGRLMDMAKTRFLEAEEYAGFTIAREKQFIETIKSLTGVEPGPVEPISSRGQTRSLPKE